MRKITYYAVWNKTHGVTWLSEAIHKTKEEAEDHVTRMVKYYLDIGDKENAKEWVEGEHVIVPCVIEVPEGFGC